MTYFTRLQNEVSRWGEKTFPDSTPDTICDHLAEEMVELLGAERVLEALGRAHKKRHYAPTDNPAEESADILLLLLNLASRLNFDLLEETQKKFLAIRDAEWEDDEGRGYKKRRK